MVPHGRAIGRVEARAGPGSTRPFDQRVRVDVRGAGDLPRPEVRTVGLSRGEEADRDDVGFGLERQDGDVDVVADPTAGGAVDPSGCWRLGQRRRVAGAAVHEEAVIDARADGPRRRT